MANELLIIRNNKQNTISLSLYFWSFSLISCTTFPLIDAFHRGNRFTMTLCIVWFGVNQLSIDWYESMKDDLSLNDIQHSILEWHFFSLHNYVHICLAIITKRLMRSVPNTFSNFNNKSDSIPFFSFTSNVQLLYSTNTRYNIVWNVYFSENY